MKNMIERHALKFAALSVVQQQRAMKKLAASARAFSKASLENADSLEAQHYDWQRRVRLSRESRAINLVRAFLKGVPYKMVENSTKFHTMDPELCVTDYGPFTMTVQEISFNNHFKQWVKGEFRLEAAS